MNHQLHLFTRRKARKLPPAKEFATHCAVADLLRVSLSPGWIWFHYPAGENRDARTGARLKRMGTKAGVADFLFISPPNGLFHALELKRGNLKPTPEQLEFLHQVKAAGGKANWCNSFDGAVAVLKHWGALRVAQ
jgi:hypothetical protein